jgi:hypothetical protein
VSSGPLDRRGRGLPPSFPEIRMVHRTRGSIEAGALPLPRQLIVLTGLRAGTIVVKPSRLPFEEALMSRRKHLAARGATGRILSRRDPELLGPNEVRRLVDAAATGLRDSVWCSVLGRMHLTGKITSAQIRCRQALDHAGRRLRRGVPGTATTANPVT